jgi:hypothetical protein
MKLNEFFSPKITNKHHAVWCFGRFSVPHKGHAGLIRTMMRTAYKQSSTWFLFASKSHDHTRNPLSYEQKIKWLYKLFPILGDHLIEDESIRTYMQAAAYLYDQGYRTATVVVGEDDLADIKEMLTKYNGHQPEHEGGVYYHFTSLTFVPAPRITSATSAREDVMNNDIKSFTKDTGVSPATKVDGQNLFNTVKRGLLVV